MVDESGEVSLSRGVHDSVGVRPEEVAAPDPHLLVLHLSEICDALAHYLTHVLHQHGVCFYFTETINTKQDEKASKKNREIGKHE